ncbi:E3 ubiquitin-protein ligase RNF182 [Alosa alosa]|uniref:E3 ubiquitin-protein ligase RNF182 n=1 Tax=Alosa alosa TaxID=278164 RepID=UPI00201536A8|nr:E3 ubiquitin-protein ligase RNF182 [Alosa alosa]
MSAMETDQEEREEAEEERRDLETEETDGATDMEEREGERDGERDGESDPDERPPSSPDELECKICYQRYSSHGRRPKLLACLHRVCARCLRRMLDLGASGALAPSPGGLSLSLSVSCPFCRHPTPLGQLSVDALPDDANLMGRLERRPTRTSCGSEPREVLLTPHGLASLGSPDHEHQHDSSCFVITILEVQRDSLPSRHADGLSTHSSSSSSLDSASLGSAGGGAEQEPDDALSRLCVHVRRVLVWLLGCFYFGSLPLGIYLLVIQRVTLGIVCVSLVPTSLTVCLVYGFCQCLCQGLCDCVPRT